MKKIAILGATGSVGRQAIDIAQHFPDKLEVAMLSAHQDVDGLVKLANLFKVQCVALSGEGSRKEIESGIHYPVQVAIGKDEMIQALIELKPDLVILAVLGIAGLPAFVACLQNGIPVALANKESLVCGADIVRNMMDETKTPVLPVDSEHSAIFQCLNHTYDVSNVERLWITASGGPFLHCEKSFIDQAPLEKALKHPNWSMGQKITIDSASLANKGLEVIEAHFMYRLPKEQISVLVHPKSIVHSLVSFKDASVLAQLGPTDMRQPLQRAMLYPEIVSNPSIKPLDFYEISSLEFLKPDFERFPCLALAYIAIERSCTAVYNIANEVAVAAYLQKKISFGSIASIIEEGMNRFGAIHSKTIQDILDLDREVRDYFEQNK